MSRGKSADKLGNLPPVFKEISSDFFLFFLMINKNFQIERAYMGGIRFRFPLWLTGPTWVHSKLADY